LLFLIFFAQTRKMGHEDDAGSDTARITTTTSSTIKKADQQGGDDEERTKTMTIQAGNDDFIVHMEEES
jgi:hypothetical protein